MSLWGRKLKRPRHGYTGPPIGITLRPKPATPAGHTGPTGPTSPQTGQIFQVVPSAYSSVGYSMTSMPSTEIEDKGLAIEPIIGWRAFGVKAVETLNAAPEYELVSLNGVSWPYRRPLEALCNGNLLADHDVPKPSCSCGIYAWNKESRGNAYSNHNSIYGEVYLWGDVLICDHGYRAEIAYPKRLFLSNPVDTRASRRVREGLIEAYGVPVEYEPGSRAAAEEEFDVTKLTQNPIYWKQANLPWNASGK